MSGKISFEQELRATRLASGKKKVARSDAAPEPKENDRPWQQDIEQVQQTLREVLRAIASFSGVEIPGLPAGVQDDSAPAPRLDIKTLKDRFRNDLDGFSLKTTEELAKRAREQTRAALDAVQSELGGHIEQVAAEMREQLQLPVQMEKLLRPCLEESTAGLEKSLSQKFEDLSAEQERLVQGKLQDALSSIETQMRSLEGSVQQIRELKAGTAAQPSAEMDSKVENLIAERERLIQERLQGALGSIQAQMSTLEASVQQVRELKADSTAQPSAELNSQIENLFAGQERLIQDRIQGALSSIQAQMSTLEENVRKAGEIKDDSAAKLSAELHAKLEHLLAERDRLIQDRIQGALSSVQAQMSAQVAAQIRELLQAPAQIEKLLEPCIGQTAARLEKSFVPKIELVLNEQEQSVQDTLRGVLSSIQAQMGTLEQSVRQMRELKADSAAQTSAEVNSKVENLLAEKERSIQERLQGALSSIQIQMSTLEQSVRQIRELKADSAAQTSAELNSKVETLLAEKEQLIQGRIQTALGSVQVQMNALKQNVQQIRNSNGGQAAQVETEQQNAALESSIFGKVERLFAQQDLLIQGRLKVALSSIQSQMNALEQKMEQMRELKAALVTELSAEQPTATVDGAMRQAETSLNNGFKEFLDRSFSRIEGSISSLMETPRFKPVQVTHAKLESLRKAIPNGSTEMLIRVQQALDNLDRLGSKKPIPAS